MARMITPPDSPIIGIDMASGILSQLRAEARAHGGFIDLRGKSPRARALAGLLERFGDVTCFDTTKAGR